VKVFVSYQLNNAVTVPCWQWCQYLSAADKWLIEDIPPPETIPPRSGVRVSASFQIFSRGLISGWDYLRTACSWITVTVWSWELLQNWRSWRLHIDMTWLLWCDFSSQQNCMFSLANYLSLLAVSWLFSDMTCTHRLSLRRLLHSAIYHPQSLAEDITFSLWPF